MKHEENIRKVWLNDKIPISSSSYDEVAELNYDLDYKNSKERFITFYLNIVFKRWFRENLKKDINEDVIIPNIFKQYIKKCKEDEILKFELKQAFRYFKKYIGKNVKNRVFDISLRKKKGKKIICIKGYKWRGKEIILKNNRIKERIYEEQLKGGKYD